MPGWLGSEFPGLRFLAEFLGIEGLIDHEWLGLHHVNETVPRAQWVYWDLAFLLWGAVMLLIGWCLMRGETARPDA
ncbi:MAG: DUF2243 domain-containing protein [Cytophagaceae bacterium]